MMRLDSLRSHKVHTVVGVYKNSGKHFPFFYVECSSCHLQSTKSLDSSGEKRCLNMSEWNHHLARLVSEQIGDNR